MHRIMLRTTTRAIYEKHIQTSVRLTAYRSDDPLHCHCKRERGRLVYTLARSSNIHHVQHLPRLRRRLPLSTVRFGHLLDIQTLSRAYGRPFGETGSVEEGGVACRFACFGNCKNKRY